MSEDPRPGPDDLPSLSPAFDEADGWEDETPLRRRGPMTPQEIRDARADIVATTGAILGTTVRTLFSSLFFPLVLVALAVAALGRLVDVAFGGPDLGLWETIGHGAWRVVTVFVAQGAVSWFVVKRLQGERAGLHASLTKGLVYGAQSVVAGGLLVAPVLLAVAAFDFGGGFLAPLLAFAFYLAMPLAVIGYCGVFVAIPAMAIEGVNIIESFGRSLELTRGRRGEVFVALFVLAALWIVWLILWATAPEAGAIRELDLWFELPNGLLTAAWATCAAVTYHLLRIEKDRQKEIEAVFE